MPQVHRCDIASWDAVLALVRADETIVDFFGQKACDPLLRSKAYILASFAPFGWRKCTVATSGPGMPFCHEFGPTKLLLSFLAKSIQSTTLGQKLKFWVVSHHLVAASALLPQGAREVHQVKAHLWVGLDGPGVVGARWSAASRAAAAEKSGEDRQ